MSTPEPADKTRVATNTSNRENRPILVTGAHRTGTTWVGKMLTASGEAAYISEPLNVLHRPGVLSIPTQYWYTYICADNEGDYLPSLQDTLRYHYHLAAEIRALHSRKDIMRMWRDAWIFLKGRITHQRPLLKDPFAIFSIPWFIERLNCQAVVTVRHPAPFASSLKRLNWSFNFADLLEQPLLIRDWLEPYRAQMQELLLAANQETPDILAQASLLWRLIYQSVTQMSQQHPEIKVVRHEDLSTDPLSGYRDLYKTLDLHFTLEAQNAILASSSTDNPKEVTQRDIYSTRLDSQANIHNWKKRLSVSEIQRIRQLTEDVAEHYYPDFSWE